MATFFLSYPFWTKEILHDDVIFVPMYILVDILDIELEIVGESLYKRIYVD